MASFISSARWPRTLGCMSHFSAPSFGWPYKATLFASVLPFAVAAILFGYLKVTTPSPTVFLGLLKWGLGSAGGIAVAVALVALPPAIWRLMVNSDARTPLNVAAVLIGALLIGSAVVVTWGFYINLHAT